MLLLDEISNELAIIRNDLSKENIANSEEGIKNAKNKCRDNGAC